MNGLTKFNRLVCSSPAKINRFLHICGQRSDGYHQLQTVFQYLDWSDTLTFELRDDATIQLHCDDATLANEDNLCVRAAFALREYTGLTQGVHIALNKRLPTGAGLGGGSSNAATTLVALNKLWSLALSQSTLLSLAKGLGADVPFFIYGHAAWGEGIGEQLTYVEPNTPWVVLLIPNCHVSTQKIFSHSKLTRHSKTMKMATFVAGDDSSLFTNDCEPLVRRLYPEVDQAFIALMPFATPRLTGTGSCVFALLSTDQEALAIQKALSCEFQCHVAKVMNTSPLYANMSL